MQQSVLKPGIPPAPDMDEVARRYQSFDRALSRSSTAAAAETVREWDRLRRELETWSAVAQLRFEQDTRDPVAQAARQRSDEISAVLTGFDTSVKRRLAGSDSRAGLESTFGGHAFRLWDNDLATYQPSIESDLVVESELGAKYTQILAGIEIEFKGERINLPGMRKFASDSDRSVRHAAAAATWAAYAEHGKELDDLYGRLVELRTAMARKLGYPSFTELGYARMRRVDYNRAAVERYRDAVREHVVPLVVEMVRRAGQRLGVADFSLWDENFLAADGPPEPRGGADWIMDHTIEGFEELDPRLGSFAKMMRDLNLTDLPVRAGKAGGAFCTGLPALGVPYVFTNCNGTMADVNVLMHELGHAFQAYSSRNLPMADYLWPTMEAAEVHSMSLEFLSWPIADRFFGETADAYRTNHLADSLAFLPYGVAVDHFQHLVYERPEATAQERHAMWQFVERRYLPWRAYGDLERPSQGALWQAKQHIYVSPFYYIDYTLALVCALQMWVSARENLSGTMERYIALCRRGGEAPFRSLMKDAGLADPFDSDALPVVVEKARAVLGL